MSAETLREQIAGAIYDRLSDNDVGCGSWCNDKRGTCQSIRNDATESATDAVLAVVEPLLARRVERLGALGTRRVEQALRAADAGEAHHWPTIASRLAGEVRRLRVRLALSTPEPGGQS